MLIPVSNEELDNVPVVTRGFRKGEMCVGRVKHRKCAIKDRGVEQGRAVCHCQLCACPQHPPPLLEHLPDLLW